MKIDIPKLPVAEAVVGFFIVVIIVTFIGAFSATGGGAEGEAVSGSPTPRESPQDGGTPSPDGDGAGPIAVTMKDNSFDPEEVTVSAGSTVTFDVTNDGGAIHNMHIAGPDGEFAEDFCEGGGDPCSDPTRVRGGDKATLTWEVPDSPGEVGFRCDFHPQQMTGKITIE
jgi:plastocyanin